MVWSGVPLVLWALSGACSAQTPPDAPGNPYLLGALNAARLGGCNGNTSTKPALREDARLSAAAARLAAGRPLGEALKDSAYRALRVTQITLSGFTGTAAQMQEAVNRSCSVIINSELTEAGFHRRDKQAWIVLAAPFLPPAAVQVSAVQAQVLALVNDARAKPRRCGSETFAAAESLRLSAALQGVASGHAANMAQHSFFDHAGRDGLRVDGRATGAGYRWRNIGENIAAGQMNANLAVQGWLDSPGHCANIMSPVYSEMGAAFAVNDKSTFGIYWVQVFGTAR